MKKVFYLLIPVMLTMFSCNRDSQSSSTEKIEISADVIKVIMKDYNEATQLLGVKFNISGKNAELITSEYIKIYDPIMHRLITGVEDDKINEKIFNPDETLTEFINRVYMLTGEPKEKISSYLLELKMYLKTMDENN
jgi:hypothetical protein